MSERIDLNQRVVGLIETIARGAQAARRAVYENIPVSSIVGESFAGVVTTSTIQPAFRLAGRDVSAAEMAEAARRSGLPRLTLCLPGIFNDETIWDDRASKRPIMPLLRKLGSFPIGVRVNPGAHFSDSGRGLLGLMEDFLTQPDIGGRPVDVLTYSQGGLIFRSALLQARQGPALFPGRVRRAVLVSSPDGGSYWEKLGFWVGRALEATPITAVRWAGFIGNQRSPAIKDLSHGIIREQDWRDLDQLKRYQSPHYFGELDAVDAYQVYSLLSDREDAWAAWFGDGMVERSSLTLLSDAVYRRKPSPKKRVTCLPGVSHFKILQAAGLGRVLRGIFTAR